MVVFKISSQIPENVPVGTQQPVGAGKQVLCGRAVSRDTASGRMAGVI